MYIEFLGDFLIMQNEDIYEIRKYNSLTHEAKLVNILKDIESARKFINESEAEKK